MPSLADHRRHGVNAPLKCLHQSAGAVRHASSFANGDDTGKNLGHGTWTENEEFRPRLYPFESALDIIGGSIADGTGVLGENEIGRVVTQRGSIDVKRTLTPLHERPHHGFHLRATEYGSVNAAAADHRFVSGFWGVVTKIAHPHEVIAKAQGVHDLSAAGK
jgi:hypothetical protein